MEHGLASHLNSYSNGESNTITHYYAKNKVKKKCSKGKKVKKK